MKLYEIPLFLMALSGCCFLCGLDAAPAQADVVFGTPTNLGPKVNTSEHDDSPRMPADGLSLFFSSTRLGGIPVYDLFVITRETLDDEWSAPVNLGAPVNTAGIDITPTISADGLTLVFASDRPGGSGGVDVDLWIATRQTKEGPWGAPVHLGGVVNSPNDDWTPFISADTLELYFGSDKPGGYGNIDLWVTRRATPQSDWEPPVNLGATVNSLYEDYGPSFSPDGLCLMFSSTRPGGYGSRDVWITTRASRNDPWRTPWNPGPPLNSPAMDGPGSISPDGSTLYFSSSRSGGYGLFDLWQVPITRIVDFNGDGKVDGDEVSAMARHLGQSESLYDIGPSPFGNGTVDANDLIVLAEYIGKEIVDPTLVVCWKLDETSGAVAYDSAGAHLDAAVMGSPAWQPAGGMIAGALQFDSVDDYVKAPYVFNPSTGPFSVLAWVKGGAPGQVILSQSGVSNWLSVDSAGHIGTELKTGRRDAKALWSQTVVTDGSWHRVGLVWDGTNRILSVDDGEAGRDLPGPPVGSSGGLYIGVGAGLQTGSFWSGLIDDVRIYNRAVCP